MSTDSIKILGVNFTYNGDIFIEKKFCNVIEKIEKVLSAWRWRYMTIAGEITIFNSLAFSKIIFVTYLTAIPEKIVKQIEIIQNEFIWEGKKPSVRYLTMVADYADGGLKMIHVRAKFHSLKLAWVKRLSSNNFHPWMNIPKYFFKENVRFFPNIKNKFSKNLPTFYIQLIHAWSELNQEPITPETVLTQYIWNNVFIKIDNLPIKKLFNFDLFVGDLFHGRDLIQWNDFKNKYNLSEANYFKFRQILASIPRQWKKTIEDADFETVFDRPAPHVLNVSRIIPVDKLFAKYGYCLLLRNIKLPPSSQLKISEKIGRTDINWPVVYTLMHISTLDSYARIFHFKCSHNVLFLNERLFKMGVVENPKCSFCKLVNEDINHLFYECIFSKRLWNKIKSHFRELNLPELTPESAYLGFQNVDDILVNLVHIVFKISLYKTRHTGITKMNQIISKVRSFKLIEENITLHKPSKRDFNRIKWEKCPDSRLSET